MKQKYEHIQLLRALACIGVFITHLAPRLGATGKAAWLANQGAAGVYLFLSSAAISPAVTESSRRLEKRTADLL